MVAAELAMDSETPPKHLMSVDRSGSEAALATLAKMDDAELTFDFLITLVAKVA